MASKFDRVADIANAARRKAALLDEAVDEIGGCQRGVAADADAGANKIVEGNHGEIAIVCGEGEVMGGVAFNPFENERVHEAFACLDVKDARADVGDELFERGARKLVIFLLEERGVFGIEGDDFAGEGRRADRDEWLHGKIFGETGEHVKFGVFVREHPVAVMDERASIQLLKHSN